MDKAQWMLSVCTSFSQQGPRDGVSVRETEPLDTLPGFVTKTGTISNFAAFGRNPRCWLPPVNLIFLIFAGHVLMFTPDESGPLQTRSLTGILKKRQLSSQSLLVLRRIAPSRQTAALFFWSPLQQQTLSEVYDSPPLSSC